MLNAIILHSLVYRLRKIHERQLPNTVVHLLSWRNHAQNITRVCVAARLVRYCGVRILRPSWRDGCRYILESTRRFPALIHGKAKSDRQNRPSGTGAFFITCSTSAMRNTLHSQR